MQFMTRLNPKLLVNLFELRDPVGLAGTFEKIEACVLTREVEKGGKMVEAKRAENKLKPLEMVYVDMVLADVDKTGVAKFSNKISSTNIRKYLAAKQALE